MNYQPLAEAFLGLFFWKRGDPRSLWQVWRFGQQGIQIRRVPLNECEWVSPEWFKAHAMTERPLPNEMAPDRRLLTRLL